MISRQFLKFACQYSTRSLLRNRRRTFLLIATITVSISVSVVARQYSQAIFSFWVKDTTENGVGHAQIHKQGYWERNETVSLDIVLKPNNDIEKALANDPDVEAFSRRLIFDGVISSQDKSIYFIGHGVEPETEKLISTRLFTHITGNGSFISSENKTGIAIGAELAKTLNIAVGDEVRLTGQTARKQANSLDAVVIGIIEVPSIEWSKRMVYAHISFAQDFLDLPGHYSELGVRVRDLEHIEEWYAKRQQSYESAGGELRPWYLIFPPMRKIQEIIDSIIGIVSLLLFLSAAISVLNIIFIMVGERTIEIGTLIAIGAKPRDVEKLFTIEAIILGLFGAGVGAIVSNAVVFLMSIFGMPLPNPFFPGYVFFFPEMSLLTTIVVCGAAVLICYASAIIPARRAAQIEPVVAFRGQIT